MLFDFHTHSRRNGKGAIFNLDIRHPQARTYYSAGIHPFREEVETDLVPFLQSPR